MFANLVKGRSFACKVKSKLDRRNRIQHKCECIQSFFLSSWSTRNGETWDDGQVYCKYCSYCPIDILVYFCPKSPNLLSLNRIINTQVIFYLIRFDSIVVFQLFLGDQSFRITPDKPTDFFLRGTESLQGHDTMRHVIGSAKELKQWICNCPHFEQQLVL